jgi:hypothetical protein
MTLDFGVLFVCEQNKKQLNLETKTCTLILWGPPYIHLLCTFR